MLALSLPSARRTLMSFAAILGLTVGLSVVSTAAAPTSAEAATVTGSVSTMNVKIGKRNNDVQLYQRALRAYAPKVGVSANKYNPAGATGFYGTETQALTRAVYLAIAKRTGDATWKAGDLRLPSKRLLTRIGLKISPTPYGIRNLGTSTKLITVEGASMSSRTGSLVLWQLKSGKWTKVATYSARFGAKGLVKGSTRKQGTYTTPTGLFSIPFTFGTAANPGTSMSWRPVTKTAWWCEDVKSTRYNRWVDPLPKDCRGSESEHLITYKVYNYAALIDFNYTNPVKGRGAGIFLHTNGTGYTAGCVSIPEIGMKRVLTWMTPGSKPRIAIGSSTSLVNDL